MFQWLFQFLKVTKIVLYMGIVTLFVACQPPQKTISQTDSNAPLSQIHPPQQGPQIQGTGDGGGGNLCLGKPLESYSVKIEDTEAFIKFVKPILDQLAKTNEGDTDVFRLLTYSLKKKNWYIIPCPLKTLPPEKIGSMVETDQGAIQDFREVWMAKTEFPNDEALSSEAFADLVLHEMFMGLRLLKYNSEAEGCRAFAPTAQLCKNMNEKPRGKASDVTFNDHQDVRRATALLKAIPKEDVSHEKLIEIFMKTQITLPYKEFYLDTESKYSGEEALMAFETAAILKDFPNTLKATNASSPKKPCALKMEFAKDRSAVRVQVNINNGEFEFDQTYFIIDKMSLASNKLSSSPPAISFRSFIRFDEFSTMKAGDHKVKFDAEVDFLSRDSVTEFRIEEIVCTEEMQRNSPGCSGWRTDPNSSINYTCIKQ